MDRTTKQIINFVPGPAKVYPNVKNYLLEAYNKNFINTYHREKNFSEIYEKIIFLLQSKLQIPENYEIYFISSATEAFSIVVREYGQRFGSSHLFSGSFGERWFNYAKSNYKEAFGFEYSPNVSFSHLSMLFYKAIELSNLICITHIETSDSFEFPINLIKTIPNNYNKIIAVDITTSLGAYPIPWEYGDIWFASLQKCMGLPPGMALLIVSPKAIDLAPHSITYYNSILNLHKNYTKLQTTHTPPLINIYLLYKVLKNDIISIEHNYNKVLKNYNLWKNWLKNITIMKPLIESENLRAKNLIILDIPYPNFIKPLFTFLELNGVKIANGHQKYKNKTIRIANFPQHTEKEIIRLQQLLTYFLAII